jgi:hypothetical protein
VRRSLSRQEESTIVEDLLKGSDVSELVQEITSRPTFMITYIFKIVVTRN